ncbi:MAG: hypothetical protein K8R76_02905 [Candidatus Aegiribacteria sp.]|nr:hypothetical protein [Candidatus Aegiribacteria sp.]
MLLFTVYSLLATAVIAFASSSEGAQDDTDAITLTVVNHWPIYECSVYGLDVWENGSSMGVAFCTYDSDSLLSFDPEDWNNISSLGPLAASNNNSYGVAVNDNLTSPPVWVTSNMNDTLFYTDDNFVTWNSFNHPGGGTQAYDMDFDGSHYWVTNGSNSVTRFQISGSSQNFTLHELGGTARLLCVFPYQLSFGLAVARRTGLLHFYSWNEASLDYLGNCDFPTGYWDSYGLAFSESRDTMFWSYSTASGIPCIYELNLGIEVSLNHSTWGAIKASY